MEQQQVVDDFLAHHGVLGMKWGHHKGGSSDSGGAGKPHGRDKPIGWVGAEKKSGLTKGDVIDARHRQIARRKTYKQAVKRGDVAGAAKAKEEFNFSQDRVTADHLIKGEKLVSVLLTPGSAVATARTQRSTQLSNGHILVRQIVGGSAGLAPIAGARVERGHIQKQINRHNAGKK